jgi:peptidoglycan/LPS O-acetylase OafA/YrhL
MRDRAERLPGLDAARALAVVAMVVGHTADGLLSDTARALPWVQVYWGFRGLTSPLFLVVSGWAVMTAASRSGLSGPAFFRDRLGRVATLIACGLALRWPGWDARGIFALEPAAWTHLLGFDALQCIAWSLFAGAALLAVVPGFAARAWALGIVAVLVPFGSASVHVAIAALEPAFPVRLALVPGPESPFALFPSAGYFFAGALVGHLLPLMRGNLLRAAALLAAGCALVGATRVVGIDWTTLASPMLFVFRLGQVLTILGAVTLIPAVASARVAPLGRSALVVYVAHLPIVYGWSTLAGLTEIWGRSLQPWQVLGVAACLLTFGLALAWALRWTKASLRALQLSLPTPTASPSPSPSATGEPPHS